MRNVQVSWFASTLVAPLVAACADGSFSSSSSGKAGGGAAPAPAATEQAVGEGNDDPQPSDDVKEKKDGVVVVVKGTGDQTLGGTYPLGSGAPISFDFSFGASKSTTTDAAPQKVNVMVALDVSSSMGPAIQTLKDSVVAFSKSLKDKKLDPSFGLVPFTDDVHPIQELTRDVDAFGKFVNGLGTHGAGDDNEASLLAVKTAAEKLALSADEDAVKVILVVTDNPGHIDGDEDKCVVDPLVAALNGLPSKQKGLIKLFSSTGKNDGWGQDTCSGYATPEAQWKDVLDKIFPDVKRGDRGGDVAYPLSADVLTKELAEAIADKTPATSKTVCVASAAELKKGDASVASWKPASLKKAYASLADGDHALWTNALKGAAADAFKGKTLDLVVTRCCVAKAAAEAGDFGACKDEVQTVKIKVKTD